MKTEAPVLGKKNATLDKKNATLGKGSRLKSLKKKFKESNLYGIPKMYIGLKNKVDDLKFNVIYPVFKIETEHINNTDNVFNITKKADKVDGDNTRDMEMTLDKDDEEIFEEEAEKRRQESANESNVIVWFLVGNQKTGKFVWVDSSDIYYLG